MYCILAYGVYTFVAMSVVSLIVRKVFLLSFAVLLVAELWILLTYPMIYFLQVYAISLSRDVIAFYIAKE